MAKLCNKVAIPAQLILSMLFARRRIFNRASYHGLKAADFARDRLTTVHTD